MRFLPPDDEVVLYETTFDKDLLGRVNLSKHISNIVEKIEDPLVIALDGQWGTGKTYFLKRWVAAHTRDNGGTNTTIYFDSFANDYLSDPLVALVAALSDRLQKDNRSKISKLKQTTNKLIKPATRLSLSIATAGATTVLSDVGDLVAKAIEEEGKKAFDELWRREQTRHQAMREFHNAIKALTITSGSRNVQSLVFLIDELDRCRPDYALEVLEVVKHFFAVPHVHFILGINSDVLENSVKARYGIEIDAAAYLRKFISFSINLPKHIGDREKTLNILAYVDFLGDAMQIPPHLLGEIRQQLRIISRSTEISIRDINKIMSRLNLLPSEAQDKNTYPGWRMVAITLIITIEIRPDYFRKITSKNLSEAELEQYFGASKKYLSEFLESGDWNPDQDRELIYRYPIWKWMVSNGSSVSGEEKTQIARLFERYGHIESPVDYPEIIYDRWLSIFTFT